MSGTSRAPSPPRALRRIRAGLAGLSLAVLAPSPASASQVMDVRLGRHPAYTRVVIELDEPAGYRLFLEEDVLEVRLEAGAAPERIESQVGLVESIDLEASAGAAVARIRLRQRNPRVREHIFADPPRIVLDLSPGEAPAVAAESPSAAGPAAGGEAGAPVEEAAEPVPLPEPEPEAPEPAQEVPELPAAAEAEETPEAGTPPEPEPSSPEEARTEEAAPRPWAGLVVLATAAGIFAWAGLRTRRRRTAPADDGYAADEIEEPEPAAPRAPETPGRSQVPTPPPEPGAEPAVAKDPARAPARPRKGATTMASMSRER